MGDPRGFLKLKRQTCEYRPACERIKDYREVTTPPTDRQSREQAARCMDCGTPFCHWGCPVGNYIPEWNDLVFNRQWERAFELLDATNCLPEVTGRVCPALCEYACVLGINDEPVTVRDNELAIIEQAFKKGYIVPRPPHTRTGKKVAVVGAGPAGLACAVELNRVGHKVTVFERDDKIGGIMRYGIPDFKLEKWILDRRIDIWKKEGIEFKTGVDIGRDKTIAQLLNKFNAVCLAGGARTPRNLKIEGRELKGIHFAMDYLVQSNRRVAGEKIPAAEMIDAKNKRVVVIGGGDTGSDCVGTANRQGADGVIQIEVLPKPPACRTDVAPWPKYPNIFKTTSSHEEGVERHWSIVTKKFIGEKGAIKKLLCEKDGKEFEIKEDLVILAVGFIRQEIKIEPGVFLAGDLRTGPSLIIKAIADGRRAAKEIESYIGA